MEAKLYSHLYDYQKNLSLGKYSISSNLSNAEILELLYSPKVELETINFTIPEGFTIVQIAERLETLDIAKSDDFLKAATSKNYDYPFLANIPEDTKYPLEGYLFPDTYTIRKEATCEEIIIKMLDRFEEISSRYQATINASYYTLHDLVTMASIVEQEAQLADERSTIAGVIYNRLKINMPLQMCSSIQYLLEKRKANLTLDDLRIESPYNTYRYKGLPPGPIACPGEASLVAVLYPDEHDYLFFVLKNSEEGAHVFSSTAEEHEFNKIRYEQSLDKNFLTE